MQCPKCGAGVDALEHAREQGYRPMPTVEQLIETIEGVDNANLLEDCEVKELAQALHDDHWR